MKPGFRNIIVGGDVGTGTSSLAKNLAQSLAWEFISAGSISRQYHLENNIPLWNKAAVPEDFEKSLDEKIFDIVKNKEHYVVDSHYAAWFARDLKDVFKILLVCDLDIVQKRVAQRSSTHDEKPDEVVTRIKQLKDKFRELYSTDDYEDPKFYHLVIDTGKTSIQDSLAIALKNFNNPKREWC